MNSIEWAHARTANPSYGLVQDPYGNEGMALRLGDGIAIEGTPDELRTMLGQARRALDDRDTTCRHCGDPIGPRDHDGAYVDANGLQSCAPHAPLHEPED